MKTRQKILLCILLIAGIMCGCNKPKELGEFMLGDYKALNPFYGNETLVYKHSESDSVYMFYGDGRYSEVIENETTNNPIRDYWVNEKDYCSFTTQDEMYSLKINMHTYGSSGASLFVYYYWKVGIDTIYRRGAELNLPLSVDNYNSDIYKFYIDSLRVFENCYKEVFGDSLLMGGYSITKNIHTTAIYPTKFYYTKTDGIIQIDFNDDTYLGLTEVISP